MSLSIGISGSLVAAALYLFVFHHSAHVRRMGTVTVEIDGLSIESETRVRWIPFFQPQTFEELRVLDEENYYILREKHPLPEIVDEL